jgi:hypothetical protein
MHLIFSDDSAVELSIFDIPISHAYKKIYKHLSKLEIPFLPWNSPYYLDNVSYVELVDRLAYFGKQLSIDIDIQRCLSRDQNYFNFIHTLYEQGYQGDPRWLTYHDHIHMCERYLMPIEKFLFIDYREKAGPLMEPMQPLWLENTTTEIKAGDVCAVWTELGKTPYGYWKNKEPNDLDRLCELAKPWLTLIPKFFIALEDHNTLANKHIDQFELWWQQYRRPWCQHWGLSDWTTKNIFGVSVFGKVTDVDAIDAKLKINVIPRKIVL